MKNKKIDAGLIVSVCAIVISLVTLIVTFYQTALMSKQQRANAMPYLEFG